MGFLLMFGSACVDCTQVRIGAAVCEAHLAAVIKVGHTVAGVALRRCNVLTVGD